MLPKPFPDAQDSPHHSPTLPDLNNNVVVSVCPLQASWVLLNNSHGQLAILWVRKFILHSCSDSFAIHFCTTDLEKCIWNLVLFLNGWVSTVSTHSTRHIHAHAWPVGKTTQYGLWIQQVIQEQFISELSPYEYCSAFLSHSLLFLPMLSTSSFLVLGWFSEGYFSSTGTFKGMWAVKLKVDYFTECKSLPSKSEAIWIAFLDHCWKHILSLHVTQSWSHICLTVA